MVLPNHQHKLKMGRKLFPETSENLHILTRLSARENFIVWVCLFVCCLFLFVCLFVCDSFNDSVAQNSPVIIVTILWGSISVRDEIFVISEVSVPALGPTQGTAQWVQAAVPRV